MKEDFLHYVWKFQKFNVNQLLTVQTEKINVVKVGEHNHHAGPDFFNAQIVIDKQLWAGNVEIHLKSSDWYAHNHQLDVTYENVILHVVWLHDTEIFRKNNTVIPTLELSSIINRKLLKTYQQLFSKQKKWIPCENNFSSINSFKMDNWIDRLYFERLEEKSIFISKELKQNNNYWEAVLFKLVCKNFGLKVNKDAFYSIANSIDFSVIKKCNTHVLEMEALFFGQAGLLEIKKESFYFSKMCDRYAYLKHKFKLNNRNIIAPKYFRLRPSSFPTIRLSQLANLYTKKQSLFSEIINANSSMDLYSIFNVTASPYWDTHYNFEVSSSKRKKTLSKKFIDLLLINTIIPIKFSYAKSLGKDVSEEIIALASSIAKEDNSIIKKFSELRPFVKNAFQTQALLQLKNEYCNKSKCLQCSIGNFILK